MITPRRLADPVNPEVPRPLPDQLLGGLDFASLALGAVTMPSYDPALEDQLHDGLTYGALGFEAPGSSLPLALTVDLAGETPVPVAGIVLNPLAGDALRANTPRDFELLLSADGVTFEPALSGQMTTLPIDQPFVLDVPIEAAYAQLRIDSLHGGSGYEVNLGEWKVIAVPGTPAPVEPLNVADPALGGHVVWMEPQQYDPHYPEGVLTDDGTAQTVALDERAPVAWVVAFREERAAAIAELQWQDPVPSNPDERLRRVAVAVSVDGPAGPWQDVGIWELERTADGSVAPFAFEQPTWARCGPAIGRRRRGGAATPSSCQRSCAPWSARLTPSTARSSANGVRAARTAPTRCWFRSRSRPCRRRRFPTTRRRPHVSCLPTRWRRVAWIAAPMSTGSRSTSRPTTTTSS